MWSLLFARKEGFENEFQLSGGQLIATGLNGGNSLIFCKAENGNKSLSLRLTDETPHPFGCGVFVPVDGFEK